MRIIRSDIRLDWREYRLQHAYVTDYILIFNTRIYLTDVVNNLFEVIYNDIYF